MLDQRDENTRYQVLETIRDYAHEKLEQDGGLAATAVLHCNHYFKMAKAAREGLRGAEQADWVWRVETEIDNVRAAMALALSGGIDPIIAVKIAVAMQGFWILRGYSTEGRKLVATALAIPAIRESDLAQGHALYVGAALAVCQSDYDEARQMLENCLALRRRLGNPLDIAATLSTLSMARLPRGDSDGARTAEEEALRLFRQIGNREGEAIGLLHLGQIELDAGNDTQALGYLNDCLALARAIKQQQLEGDCERQLGEIALDADDRSSAVSHLKRSLTICRDAGDKRGVARALWWLGKAELREGDIDGARRSLSAALTAFRTFEMREDLVSGLGDWSALAAAEGRIQLAVQLTAAVDHASERLALRRPPRSAQRWVAHVDSLRASLTSGEFEAARSQGNDWDIDEALRRAQSRAEADAGSGPASDEDQEALAFSGAEER
jgi:tetratricopeptide (TPR) repeat protein